ncbi:PilN domain-containing protein [Paenibacillus cremeus]|uniref:Fimbrial protein n=1 Tax=Paenibacillus cremeus TaxID=2163881 RepID=A0A559KE80_9BACL|nr:PilN domain-containing protein [Paenibacillus cremeus]TVY10413.1 hypothetical protein FPZ49_08430 [Paenibacillus cremeus]
MNTAVQRTQSIEINLLQIRMEDDRSNSRVIPVLLVVMFATATLAMGWIWFSSKSAITQTNESLKRVNAQIKESQSKLATTPSIGGIADFIALPQALSQSRPNATEVLDKLAPLLPAAANMTSLSFEDGGKIKLTGNFASSEEVIAFMQAVKSSGSFSLISTTGMTKTPAVPDDKNASANAEAPPLPVIQATFDLKFTADANKKG